MPQCGAFFAFSFSLPYDLEARAPFSSSVMGHNPALGRVGRLSPVCLLFVAFIYLFDFRWAFAISPRRVVPVVALPVVFFCCVRSEIRKRRIRSAGAVHS